MSAPARQTSNRPASIPTTIFAIICLTSWWRPISSPNVRRSCAYRTLASRHACASPTAPAATVYRPWSIALIAMRKPFALLAEAVLLGHEQVLEGQQPGVAGADAELAVQGAGCQPGHAALEQKGRDPAPATGAVDRGKDQEVVGDVGEADPDLAAVQDVAAVDSPGGGLEVRGVGSDVGLGQAERRELLAARLRDEPAPALLLGPPLQDRQRVESDVDALDHAERGVGPLELLAQEREGDVVGPGAAVVGRDGRSEEAQTPQLLEDLPMDLALLVPRPDERQDLRFGELARRLLDETLLVRQLEIDPHRRAF